MQSISQPLPDEAEWWIFNLLREFVILFNEWGTVIIPIFIRCSTTRRSPGVAAHPLSQPPILNDLIASGIIADAFHRVTLLGVFYGTAWALRSWDPWAVYHEVSLLFLMKKSFKQSPLCRSPCAIIMSVLSAEPSKWPGTCFPRKSVADDAREFNGRYLSLPRFISSSVEVIFIL